MYPIYFNFSQVFDSSSSKKIIEAKSAKLFLGFGTLKSFRIM